jgi:Ca2+-binding RTX toxin-like protein
LVAASGVINPIWKEFKMAPVLPSVTYVTGFDWEEFLGHIDTYSESSVSPTSVTWNLLSSESEIPNPNGGRLVLTGTFSTPPVGTDIISSVAGYMAGSGTPDFEISNLSIPYSDLVTYAAMDRLDDYFEDVVGIDGVDDDSIDGSEGDDDYIGDSSSHNSYHGNGGDDDIEGNRGSDDLYGDAGDDDINGDNGNDMISGGDDNDHLSGENGNDDIFGDSGDDSLDGGNGNDRLAGGLGIDVLSGGNGNDDLSGGDDNDDLSGNNGKDDLAGGLGDDSLHGDNGNDDLSGDDGIDHLYGGNGVDNLYGGNDDDYLDGGRGGDLMDGGAGDDTYYVDANSDRITDDSGHDIVLATSGKYTLAAGVEDLDYIGSRNFSGTGNDLGNEISGGNGKDKLYGGSGDDLLIGGAGNDILNGGDDADLFLLDSLSGIDKITDFTKGQDHIVLDSSVFIGVLDDGSGSLDATVFANGAATTADHHVLYDSVTGKISYDADGSGSGAAVTIAQVTAGLTLDNSDFNII